MTQGKELEGVVNITAGLLLPYSIMQRVQKVWKPIPRIKMVRMDARSFRQTRHLILPFAL